jgi:hypothetical protein
MFHYHYFQFASVVTSHSLSGNFGQHFAMNYWCVIQIFFYQRKHDALFSEDSAQAIQKAKGNHHRFAMEDDS